MQTSIFPCGSHGPTFGGGHDVFMPLSATGYSNLGHTYQCRVGTYTSATCQADLAGAYNFTLTEVEVFYAQ